MATPASIAKHPIHPMLVVFPVGLWIFSLISDVIYIQKWGPPVWNDVAFYTMAGGIGGALLAAIPGLVDLVSLTDRRAKRIGIWHMILNLLIVGLYCVNLWLRMPNTTTSITIRPLWLSVAGVVLLAISGWLGGEMVYVHGVGVEQRPIDDKAARPSPSRRVA
jgi:uncharacterized membrane protein